MDALFDADRASLLTGVVLRAVHEFDMDTSQLNNDSTSISAHGAYYGAVGTVRGRQPTAAITFWTLQDHRPDLKQLVWILTVASDGSGSAAGPAAPNITTLRGDSYRLDLPPAR